MRLARQRYVKRQCEKPEAADPGKMARTQVHAASPKTNRARAFHCVRRLKIDELQRPDFGRSVE